MRSMPQGFCWFVFCFQCEQEQWVKENRNKEVGQVSLGERFPENRDSQTVVSLVDAVGGRVGRMEGVAWERVQYHT